MPRASVARFVLALIIAFALPACSRHGAGSRAHLGPPERFDWVAQPVEFSPPPAEWRREADGGGGLIGVRFILTNGGGHAMSVAAYRQWTEHPPRREIR